MGCGDEGPAASQDELRRHIYRRCGRPVRIKLKRTNGAYVNWYRVMDGMDEGWQAAKPNGYSPCPYSGAIDPFDRELSGDVLYWPEGEKDCDTVSGLCLPAFTFGGIGDGLPHGVEAYLHGRHVVSYSPITTRGAESTRGKKGGLAHAVAASVKVIEFPELPSKGDVSDYLAVASVQDLEERIANAPQWEPPNAPQAATAISWRGSVITASELSLKSFRPIRYVVPGYIPEGVTIFAGKPKVGKSWLLYDVCLGSAADRFVLGTIKPAQGDVLYLALEGQRAPAAGSAKQVMAGRKRVGSLDPDDTMAPSQRGRRG